MNHNDSEKYAPLRAFVRRTQLTAVITGAFLGLALVYLWSGAVGFGFIAGATVSIINFRLMAVDAFQLTETSPGRARKFITGRYIIRYAIMFVFLAIIATRTQLNIFAAFTGLVYIQMLLVLERLVQMVLIK